MATTPVFIPPDPSALLHDLAKRQAHFSYGVLFVLLVFVSMGGFFGYRAIQSFDRQVGEMQKQMQTDRAQYAVDKTAIADAAKQQQVIVKVVHDRDQQADQKMTDFTQADRSMTQIATDVKNAYGFDPFTFNEDLFSFAPPQVQTFTSTKVDRDRLFANNTDIMRQLDLEKGKTTRLTGDVQRFQVDATKWENLAHKSRKRKFFEGALKGLEIGGAGFVGWELGHRTQNIHVGVSR